MELITNFIMQISLVVITALVTTMINKKSNKSSLNKTEVEIEKLKAETTMINLQIGSINNNIDSISYNANSANENLIFKLDSSVNESDISGIATYKYEDQKKRIGKSNYYIESGVITVERLDTIGSFMLRIEKYEFENGNKLYIEKDNEVKRKKYRVLFDIAFDKGKVRLHCSFHPIKKGEQSIDTKVIDLETNGWITQDLFYTIPTDTECYFIINIQSITKPTVVKIRNIRIYEKKT